MKVLILILFLFAPNGLSAVNDSPSRQIFQQRALPQHLIPKRKEFLPPVDIDEGIRREIRRLESKVLNLTVERDTLLMKNAKIQKVLDESASEMMGQYINNYLLLVYFERFLEERGMELPPAMMAVKTSQEEEFVRLGLNVQTYIDAVSQSQTQDQLQNDQ